MRDLTTPHDGLGISPKVLLERLAELETSELIVKNVDAYEITLKGKELASLFSGIKLFHFKYGEASSECAEQFYAYCQIGASKSRLPKTSLAKTNPDRIR